MTSFLFWCTFKCKCIKIFINALFVICYRQFLFTVVIDEGLKQKAMAKVVARLFGGQNLFQFLAALAVLSRSF